MNKVNVNRACRARLFRGRTLGRLDVNSLIAECDSFHQLLSSHTHPALEDILCILDVGGLEGSLRRRKRVCEQKRKHQETEREKRSKFLGLRLWYTADFSSTHVYWLLVVFSPRFMLAVLAFCVFNI